MRIVSLLPLSLLLLLACDESSSTEDVPAPLPSDGVYEAKQASFTEDGCLFGSLDLSIELKVEGTAEAATISFPPATLPLGAESDGKSVPIEAGEFSVQWSAIAPISTQDADFNTVECPLEVRVAFDGTVTSATAWSAAGAYELVSGPTLDPLCEAAIQEMIPGYLLSSGCESKFTADLELTF
jgi:hypothetical protein